MLRKLLVIVLLVIGVVFLWHLINQLRGGLTIDRAAEIATENDVASAISEHLRSGLMLTQQTAPAQVSLDELGELSPVAGMVEIVNQNVDTIKNDDLAYEYIKIRALETNAQPINISNWSLQSMISDTWIGLPQGAAQYVAGEVNELGDIYLYPGETAIIASRHSPVGVSFRINDCSGYLNDTQDFTPTIRTSCLDPRETFPPTIENLREYGDACVAFVEDLSRCSYITADTFGSEELTPECRVHIQSLFTYNYCVGVRSADADFTTAQEWRIFLNQDRALWGSQYEVIRLMDENHRTVSVITY